MNMWYEMKVDAGNAITDCLECGYDGYYCDLFNEVFNMDYYVTGTTEAKTFLAMTCLMRLAEYIHMKRIILEKFIQICLTR